MSNVKFSPGHDIHYLPDQARDGGGENTTGGYYVNAAQKGEAPGRWFGKGAAALGLAEGQEVDPHVHEMVFTQVDPRTGGKLGRTAAKFTARQQLLDRLLQAEPHATEARKHELERQAAQEHRESHPYTDFTVSFNKSVSVAHASIRENARRAELAGDLAEEAYWSRLDARYCEILQEAALMAMRHLERWAVTRTGWGRRVDGQDFVRFVPAGLAVSMWLQGTSRDGDPHDHVHCAIARMCLALDAQKWLAVDTMALRAQAGAAKLMADAYVQSALAQEFGFRWEPAQASGCGNEITGVTQEQMRAYSSRAQEIDRGVETEVRAWKRRHDGRAPSRSELRRIKEGVQKRTRKGKGDEPIDWDALLVEWDATLGGDLAQIARDLGLGPGNTAQPRNSGPHGPGPDEQVAAISMALARVSAKHSAWTRGQLCGELADVMPPSVAALPPAEAMALMVEMADRAIAGEVQPVVCLDAPDFPDLPAELVRDLDGRSVFTRPGVSKYATEVQISREEKLLADAQAEAAPRITREHAARLLHADPAQLDAQLRESVSAAESSAMQPSGLNAAQQAAAFHVMTSPRRCVPIEAPAGAGKTYVLAHVAQMCRDAGIPVYGLGPSQTAVNILAAAAQVQAWNTAQFLGHLPGRRRARPPFMLERGSFVLLDEASMVSMEDLADVLELAAANNWKVVLTGDRDQLTAVESGGGFALAADELGGVQLPDPVRFTADWERAASLRLRAGDTSVLTEYADQGRILGAPPDEAKEIARRTYVAEYLAGRSPILMTGSNELAGEMNAMIRSDLRHLGAAQAGGPDAELMDGTRAGPGDPIVLRTNHHEAWSGEEGRGLANGDVLEIVSIGERGQVMARRLLGADPETGERRYTPAFSYGYLHESQLGHAGTTHRAQGVTGTVGIALVAGTEAHEWLYPAMTRGREANYAVVFTTSPNRADPRAGTRMAPELARHGRLQAERGAQDAGLSVAGAEGEDDAQDEALGVLSDVLERPGRDLSALQWQRREAANADHLGKRYAVWQVLAGEAARERYERELRAALPEAYRDAGLGGTSTWLWRTLRDAEGAGMDSADLLRRAADAQSLAGTEDVAAVVDWRIRKLTAGIVPVVPGKWSDRVPQVASPALQEHLHGLAKSMDDRTERLAAFTTETAPAWAVSAIGPVPDEPMERLEWQHRVAPVAAYREMFGWENPEDPIGPEPVNSPEARAAWHGAFAALGPVNGPDLRAEQDGRLHLMAGTYGRITAEAPRYAGKELRFVRVAARDMGLAAVRHAAEVKAALERGDAEAAARHAAREQSAREMADRARAQEARLAPAVDAYRQWDEATQAQQRLAIAAHAELQRRHPDAQLPPLRSAEAPAPGEAERRELLWPQVDMEGNVTAEKDAEQETGKSPDLAAALRLARAGERDRWPLKDPGHEHEAPQWVRDLEASARAAREKAAERQTQMVPHEDPDQGDVGAAWPGRAERERDAILQPARPQIQAAPEVAERAQGRAVAAAAADHEAGG